MVYPGIETDMANEELSQEKTNVMMSGDYLGLMNQVNLNSYYNHKSYINVQN